MSYKIENLTPLQNGKNSKVPTLWTYYNEDNDDITTANYMKKDCGLKNGDQVISISNDYTERSNYYVSINANNYQITLISQE